MIQLELGIRFLLFGCLFVSISFLAPSQNLVPNPSFECGEDRCLPTWEGKEFWKYACGWSSPNTATPDILSTLLDKDCWASMPNDISNTDPFAHIGSQMPRTGNRFAGIVTYTPWMEYLGLLWREYLQVKLENPLVSGEEYCVEMFVSAAENQLYVSNNLGFYFSEGEIWIENFINLSFTPQVVCKEIIKETANWVRVGGIFKAPSVAEYLIIGNFSNDVETESEILQPFARHSNAYYFIDDISVEKIPYQKFHFSGNLEICEGDSATLVANTGVANATWANIDDTTKIINEGLVFRGKPSQTISYVVTARGGCNSIVKDTVTIQVKPRPEVNLGPDTLICENTILKLDAGPGYESYSWQNNNSSEQYLFVTESGKYSVIVRNGLGCTASSEVSVSVKPLPAPNLGPDITFCTEPIELNPDDGSNFYLWSTGSTAPKLSPTEAGEYWVTVTNKCGQASDTVTLYALDEIFIPNILTLNGDGKNDKFLIRGLVPETPVKLTIYDRWGGVVLSTRGYNGEWPNDTESISSGVYYYALHYPACRTIKGLIHIIKDKNY